MIGRWCNEGVAIIRGWWCRRKKGLVMTRGWWCNEELVMAMIRGWCLLGGGVGDDKGEVVV